MKPSVLLLLKKKKLNFEVRVLKCLTRALGFKVFKVFFFFHPPSLSSLPLRDILICCTLTVQMVSEATDQRVRGRGV